MKYIEFEEAVQNIILELFDNPKDRKEAIKYFGEYTVVELIQEVFEDLE